MAGGSEHSLASAVVGESIRVCDEFLPNFVVIEWEERFGREE